MLLLFALAAFTNLVTGANFSSTVALNSDLKDLSYYLSLIPDFASRINAARNVTIIAPSNNAIEEALADPDSQFAKGKVYGFMDVVLSYHILNGTWPSTSFVNSPTFIKTWMTDKTWTSVSGGQVVEAYRQNGPMTIISGKKNQTTVKTADIQFDGGVIHIVDSMLSIPTNTTDTTAALNMPIATKVLSNRAFSSGIDGAFSDITIFIPADRIVAMQSSNIQSESPQDFNAVLGYHLIVGTTLYSSRIQNEQIPTYTNDNEKVSIRRIGNDIFVNQAKIIQSDILVNAGVGHVIDSVLHPGNFSLPPPPASTSASTSLTASPSSTNTSTATAAPTHMASSAGSSLSPGAYAGIGVGSAAGASVIVGIIALLCVRRHRKHKQAMKQMHEAYGNGRPRERRRNAKELPSNPMGSPTRTELASERDRYESHRRAELDSQAIMSQIPQDIYLTRAELGAEHKRHPAYGSHTSVNDYPLKPGFI